MALRAQTSKMRLSRLVGKDLMNAVQNKRPHAETGNLLFPQAITLPQCNMILLTLDFWSMKESNYPYITDFAPHDCKFPMAEN